MESKVYQPYTHYDSIIADGKRIRRMRRTELSAQKIINNNSKAKSQAVAASPCQLILTTREKKSSSKSHPKIQPKRGTGKQNLYKVDNVQNQYYTTAKNNSHLSINQNKQIKKQESSMKKSESGLKQSKNSAMFASQNSYAKIAKQMINEISQGKTKMASNGPQYTLNPNQPVNKQTNQSISRHSSRIANDSHSKMRNKLLQNISNKQFNDYGIETQKGNSKLSQQSVKQAKKELLEQSNHSKQSKQSLSKIKPNKITMPGGNQLQKQPSGFEQIAENFSKHLETQPEQANQNFSKIKYTGLQDPIINSSSPQRQSWKQAIKSLAQLSELDNSSNIEQNNKQNKLFDSSRKMSLKMDSMRQDNNTQTVQNFNSTNKNSWKHLPLASKQPSYRKSMDNSSQRADPGSLKGVLDNVEIHDFLVTLINDFKEQTQKFSQGQSQVDMLCFLLEKKYFFQKSKMIKALRGGKNIFKLTSYQIPNQYLSLYVGNNQITQVVKELQAGNRQLFKKLQKKYLQLKQKYKNNPFLKLQTPNDDFSKQIIRRLEIELEQLYKSLRNNDEEDDELEEKLQKRIFETMEIIFMMSQMSGRQVKKLQFYEDITDFEQYYSQNEQALKETFQYFRKLK